jgi:hypothetical protein
MGAAPTAEPTLPDPDDPATDAVVARHVRTLPAWAARWDARILARRERLAQEHPAVHRVLLAWLYANYLVVSTLLPRRRVVALGAVMVAATIVDSLATYVWVSTAMAVEGNPVVDGVMSVLGDGPGLVVRAVLSATFVVLLTWLARRHWEARAGMLIAAAALGGITLVHLYGLRLALT